MSFNSSSYSNSIIKNNMNYEGNSFSSNNINQIKNSISENKQIFNFCNNLSEINNQNENGYTPIYLAILYNNIQALKELLALDANPNIPNNLNETPLFLSVNISNYEAFLILMKYNSDCNIQNIKGDTPLHVAIQKKEKKFIEMLLLNNANPNMQNFTQGQTPTHLAIINKLDEDILKLFKKYKANIFHIKDKLKKTPFDYAKEINDENYLNLVLKIFGYNFFTNNGLDEVNNNNSNEEFKNIQKNNENTALNKCNYNINSFQDKEIKEFSHSNTNSNDIKNEDYYIITSETNKNEFKIDNCDSNKDRPISNNSLGINKIILSSDMSSDNVQIKELNTSTDNNLCKIKKSLTEFIHEEKFQKIDIKENLEMNNNVLSQIYNQNGNIDFSKAKSHREFSRNSDNIKNKNNNLFSNLNISNNYSHKSNNSARNSYNNLYMTNSVGANKKIIKNIIRDTIKKIKVKSLSSSDENTSNANYLLSKESEKFLPIDIKIEDNKNNKNTNSIKHQNNNDINQEKLILEKNSYISKEIKYNNINNNFYENGKFSYYFLDTKNVNDIINNDDITVSKLIPKESQTINILDNNNFQKKQNNDIAHNENENLEIKENKISEITNSNIFSDLQIKSNNNENISNNNENLLLNNEEISLSYSKNLQNEEDDLQYKLIENKLDKKLQELKNENNSNFDIKISDNQSNLDSKNNDIIHIDSKISQSNKSDSNNIIINNINNLDDDVHKKKISNGNMINSNKEIKMGINPYKIKETKFDRRQKTLNHYTIDNYMDLSEDLNGVNNNIKKKIFKKNRINNKSQIYLNKKKQLSYHNNHKEKDRDNKYLNEIFVTTAGNTINVNDHKENENPNKISIIKQRVYKNKNNILGGFYNLNSNISLKSSLKSKISNKNPLTNRGSKISLTKSGSSQNLNPPPIGGYILNIYPADKTLSSNNNILIRNSNSNNKNQNLSSPNNINLINNTTISTKKPKHSSLRKVGNQNNENINMLNIPLRNSKNENKININPFIQKNNSKKENNLINNFYDSDESSLNNINNILRNISTEELIKLRDFLISCDLLCYYNLLITKNMYHIDSYIKDIQRNVTPITYNDLEEIGIKKPGHIYRILIKLEIDAGVIQNDLFCYIIDKINFYSITSTLAMTSSSNGIFCCGINLCPNDSYNNRNKKRNNSIYFNDLSSFLRANDIIRLKGNFIHNGFDKIEFIIIQQFSKYSFDKKILNEHLHIYIDRDKNKLLNILQMIKINLSNEFGINFEKSDYSNQKQVNEVIEFTYEKNNKNDINSESNDNEEKNGNSNFCNIF